MIHRPGPMIKPSTGEQRRTTGKLLGAIPRITPAELGVCLLILEGKSTREIARELGISERTVDNQRFSIRRKMGATGNLRMELMRIRGY